MSGEGPSRIPRGEKRSGRRPRPRPKHGACPGLLARPAPPVSPCGLLVEDERRPRSERTQTNPFGTFASQLTRRDTLGQANGPKNFSGSRNHDANLRRRTVRIGTSASSVRNVIAVPCAWKSELLTGAGADHKRRRFADDRRFNKSAALRSSSMAARTCSARAHGLTPNYARLQGTMRLRRDGR
jgi:hypothetical protein